MTRQSRQPVEINSVDGIVCGALIPAAALSESPLEPSNTLLHVGAN